ncbi:MAG: hypothetical protein ABEJ57_07270 [Halobacteriaceae archaeon]
MTDLPGELVRSRVVQDLDPVLGSLLDRGFTGHVAIDPGATLLLDDDGRAILAIEDGIPRYAYLAGVDRGGPAALDALADAGPYRVAHYACPASAIGARSPGAPVDPAAPAERLTDNEALVRRTRADAPDADPADPDIDAVEAFLEDEATVEAIRDRAREEARHRASEWGLDVD